MNCEKHPEVELLPDNTGNVSCYKCFTEGWLKDCRQIPIEESNYIINGVLYEGVIFKSKTTIYYGVEDGSVCNRDNCPGIIELEPVHDCSCHICPPCRNCEDRRMHCPECGWSDE